MKAAGFFVGVGLGVLSVWAVYKIAKPALIDRIEYEIDKGLRESPSADGALQALLGSQFVPIIKSAIRVTLERELP